MCKTKHCGDEQDSEFRTAWLKDYKHLNRHKNSITNRPNVHKPQTWPN